MKNLFSLTAFVTIIIISSFSCGDNGTEPGNEVKNPREFTWTADTIYYPDSYQTIIVSTWANNENDIYAVGHTDVNEGQFWHYNGTKWECIKIFDHISHGVLSFHKIWGLSSSQIWIAGNRGGFGEEVPVVWIYNGHTIFETKFDGYHGKLTSIHGTSRENIWACGDSGLVAHYDGSQWTINKINSSNMNLDALWLDDLISEQNTVYIVGGGIDTQSRRGKDYFFKGSINNWTIADSSIEEPYGHIAKWGYRHLYLSSWNTLYSLTHGIFRLTNNSWERIITYFGSDTPTLDMMGTSENNMIIVGDFSKAYHWNGSDVYQFGELEKEDVGTLYSVELFNKEAFIFGQTNSFPQKTIVYHGK
jgi:hypothetical protein